jgi:uncharacterized protein YjdB
VNAQQLLKGDMNDDGDLTIGDVTALVEIVMGRKEPIPIDFSIAMTTVDNERLYGTWVTQDNEKIVVFDETSALYNDIKFSYDYFPNMGKLILSDKVSGLTKVILFVEKTSDSQIHIFDNELGDNIEYLMSNAKKVKNITLSSSSLELSVDETEILSATITPTNARQIVKWRSSNEEVATVAGGVVSAVGEGTATITCSATDGTEKTATCEVTVTKKMILVTDITLSESSLELEVGNTGTLEATVIPDNASNGNVIWSSSDEAVATVTDGVVTAVGEGTSTITCSAADGSGKTVTCKVKVTPKVILVTDITLSESSLELEAGNTRTLEATVIPDNASNGNVIWSSSDEAIVTVSEGVIIAVSVGTATITCSAADGSGKTATCKVKVTPKVILVTDIILSQSFVELNVGNTETIEITVAPDNASNKSVIWSSSDETVATVSDGVVTAISNGTATITCSAADGSGKAAMCEVTVIIEYEYVDLELDSGTLWATCNIGALAPEDIGTFFAWGEVQPNSYYSWSNYAHCNGTKTTLTKYCTNASCWGGGSNGPDNLILLAQEDDAATQLWGEDWCMPTISQLRELLGVTVLKTYETRTYNGITVGGIKFTHRNKSIFIPIGGYMKGNSKVDSSYGYYWSKQNINRTNISANYLKLSTDINNLNAYSALDRCYGMLIRPVRKKTNN